MRLDFMGPVDIQFRKFEETRLEIPVFRIFENVTQRNTDKIALKSDSAQLSYQQAYQYVCSLAAQIQALNKHKEPIGIALPNDVYFPVAMLAALAVGCPYVPLDIDLPEARNQLIIEQSGVKSIITTTKLADAYKALQTICIDTKSTNTDTPFVTSATPSDIAYIIYTSGSTGIPKGVYQNQRNMLHDVMQYTNSIHLNENDRLTLLYSPSVNGAIRDIYGALLNGGTLIIKNLTKGGLYDLNQLIHQEGITIYHSIPNIFRTFLKLNPSKDDLSTVRLIYLAGDRIYKADVELYKSYFGPDCLLFVGIGATEIATIYRQWFINHNTVIKQELIPIGYPVADRNMQLVDEDNNPVTDGETGEITVSSPFVSLGYWQNAEQTKVSFSIDGSNPKIRTYRTGDLGRINNDGLLEFVGRKDNQVKINGYRVELSEIEGALMDHPLVDRCGVIVQTQNQHNALIAFFMSKTALAESNLKDWLAQLLPHYMVPQRCIQVDEIPTLHNFKNDAKALKAMAEEYASQGIPPEALKSDVDFLYQALKQTWCRFLDEESFDNDVSWKNAGGDSVNAVNFLVQLESDLNVTLPTDWIYGGMTPGEIHRILQGMNILKKEKAKHIVYVFPAVKGISENTRNFLNNLSEHVTMRIISYPDFSSFAAKDRNWDYAIERIFEQITDYDRPNVGFLGICTGGLITNRLITTRIPKYYSFISIIEGIPLFRQQPIKVNFMSRVAGFLKRGYLFNNVIRLLYVHSKPFENLIVYLEEKRNVRTNLPGLFWDLYYRLRATYFNSEVWYFGCNNSKYNTAGDHWKPYFQNVNPVLLYGIHEDMLNARNKDIVLNKLLEILAGSVEFSIDKT